MTYPVGRIDGLDAGMLDRLKHAKIRTTARLLDRAKDAKGRKALAITTGIPERMLLRCANRADMLRIKGIGEDYCELLCAAGVETVRDLKVRNAANLHRALVAANAERQLVRQVPTPACVARWVACARGLPLLIRY